MHHFEVWSSRTQEPPTHETSFDAEDAAAALGKFDTIAAQESLSWSEVNLYQIDEHTKRDPHTRGPVGKPLKTTNEHGDDEYSL